MKNLASFNALPTATHPSFVIRHGCSQWNLVFLSASFSTCEEEKKTYDYNNNEQCVPNIRTWVIWVIYLNMSLNISIIFNVYFSCILINYIYLQIWLQILLCQKVSWVPHYLKKFCVKMLRCKDNKKSALSYCTGKNTQKHLKPNIDSWSNIYNYNLT